MVAPVLLIAFALFLPSPLLAADRTVLPNPHDTVRATHQFESDLKMAKGFIEELYRRGLEALGDHLEVDGAFHPHDQTGERWGRLGLKFYPKGKRESEEHLRAETWFQFSTQPGDRRLHFDLRLSENRPGSLPDEAL
jgi:hypothetical protein